MPPDVDPSLITRDLTDPSLFRAALLRVPPTERDAWLDSVLDLGDLPADGPDLPRGCVPYLPAPVDALLRVVERAPVRPSDVFVDVGSGVGRAVALVHLLTGAPAAGLEIERNLTYFLSIEGLSVDDVRPKHDSSPTHSSTGTR